MDKPDRTIDRVESLRAAFAALLNVAPQLVELRMGRTDASAYHLTLRTVDGGDRRGPEHIEAMEYDFDAALHALADTIRSRAEGAVRLLSPQ